MKATIFLYRLFFVNKKTTTQKKTQKTLKKKLLTILINKNHWNYWYRKLTDDFTETKNFVDVRIKKRITFILRENFITIVSTMTQKQSRQFAIRFDQQQRIQSIVVVEQSTINIDIEQSMINSKFIVSTNIIFDLSTSTSIVSSNILNTVFISTFENSANFSDFYRRFVIRMLTSKIKRNRNDVVFAFDIIYDRRSRHASNNSSFNSSH